MEEILKVEELSIIYKTDLETVYAVNGISFSLKQGGDDWTGWGDRCRQNDYSDGDHGTFAKENREDHRRTYLL